MARLEQLEIYGYRSIEDPIIRFEPKTPIVLVGPNNAGKSNVLRAIDLLFGEFWPGNHDPDDHERFGRDAATPIEIRASVSGVSSGDNEVKSFVWRDDSSESTRLTMEMNSGASRWANGNARDQILSVMVGTDRTLQQQIGYSSRYTFLSKLMRTFHRELHSDPDRVTDLTRLFDDIKSSFLEVESFKRFQGRLAEIFQALAGEHGFDLQAEFVPYDPSAYFQSLRLQPTEKGIVRTLDEVGSGFQRVLLISLARAYAEAFHDPPGLILALDEPEVSLHPTAVKFIAQELRAAAASGVQVIVATHDPEFVNLLQLPGLCIVRKNGGSSQVVQMSANDLATACREMGADDACTRKSVLPFYSAAATRDTLRGLFASRIVLVEGPTEELVLPTMCGSATLAGAKRSCASF